MAKNKYNINETHKKKTKKDKITSIKVENKD